MSLPAAFRQPLQGGKILRRRDRVQRRSIMCGYTVVDMNQALQLDEATHGEIKRLCAAGDVLANQGKHEAALAQYGDAWKLLPEPKSEWEAATWILAAIADSCFFLGMNKEAREALEYAVTCPGGLGNPFLHLRLGQVLFDVGEMDAAANELIRAYMGGGEELFETEAPKYLAFLRTRAQL